MATVEGADELVARLEAMAAEAATAAVREAVAAGAEVVRAAAAAYAPKRTGHLAESIMVEIEGATPAGASALIGPDRDHFYGLMVEMGHDVVLRGQTVGHVPPHPFLRPALDESAPLAQEVMAATLRARLDL